MADINKSRELDEEVTKDIGALSVKIDVDVSEAITGLKAVQREAKAATVALRELERASRCTPVEINDLRDVQGQDGNWDHDKYMCGLFNGLELASATLEGRTPDYRELEDSVKPELSELLSSITDDNQHDAVG